MKHMGPAEPVLSQYDTTIYISSWYVTILSAAEAMLLITITKHKADIDTERFSSSSLTAYDFHIYVKDD